MTEPYRPIRPVSRKAQIIGGAIALAVLAGVVWLAWSLMHAPKGEGGGRAVPAAASAAAADDAAGRPARWRWPRPAQTDLPVVIEALGTVTPAATVTVRPQVGVITQVLFREGQMVRAGQALVQIDPRQFQMDLLQAQGALTRDEAQLASARLTLARYQTLLTQDSIARQEVDTQAATVKQLEGTVMSDRAAVGTARLNLGYARIVAPVSGRVGLRVVDVGNYIGAGDANGVAVITTVSPIDVEFTVPQDDVPRIAARANTGRANAGHRPGPHPHHDPRPRHLLDPGQPGRHRHRHGEGQGPLPQRRRDPCSPASSSMSAWSWTPSRARSSCPPRPCARAATARSSGC
jgi:multidrug efflux system membrane fusion protein